MTRYECDRCHKIVVDEERTNKYAYLMPNGTHLLVKPLRCYCHNCNEYSEAQIGIKAIHIYRHIIKLGKTYSFFDKTFKTHNYRERRKEIEELWKVAEWVKEKGETDTACIKCGSVKVELIEDCDGLEWKDSMYCKEALKIISPKKSHKIQQAHERSLKQEENIHKYISIKGKD